MIVLDMIVSTSDKPLANRHHRVSPWDPRSGLQLRAKKRLRNFTTWWIKLNAGWRSPLKPLPAIPITKDISQPLDEWLLIGSYSCVTAL